MTFFSLVKLILKKSLTKIVVKNLVKFN